MDRAVLNESNLKNAILSRAVLTRSDLGGADVEGADFSNALVDRSQQIVSAAGDREGRATRVRGGASQQKMQMAKLHRPLSALTPTLSHSLTQTLARALTGTQALCRYASGTNPVTGANTRKSLGCGSSRRFKAQSPSNPDGPKPTEDEKVRGRELAGGRQGGRARGATR